MPTAPMEVATARVTLNKYGSDVPLNDLTPAEAILLHVLHGPSNGGRTFGDEFNKLTVVGTAKVDTGKTERKQVKAAIAAKKHEEVVTAASGTPGQPGYQPHVTKVVIDEPEVPAVFADVPVLADRTPAQELARLRRKYGQAKNKDGKLIIDNIWTDKLDPKLPATFKEINWQAIGEAASAPELQPTAINYVTEGLVRTT